MFRAYLLLGSMLFGGVLLAQTFDPVTVVCQDGPYVLQSPVSDDDPSTYEWEISYDGQHTWQSADVFASSITINRPRTGISYRFRYGRVEGCTTGECRQVTDATLLQVDIPVSHQEVTLCRRDTLFVGAEALTRTGDYRTVVATPEGCDSVVTTALTVLDSPEEFYFVNLCPGEEFRGRTFPRDTLLTERFQTAAGCDSILNFEIKVSFSAAPPVVTGDGHLCRGGTTELGISQAMSAYAWSDGSSEPVLRATTAGTYRVTVTDFKGCSRELTHDLTLSEVDIVSVDPAGTVCRGTPTGSIGVLASGDGPLRYGLAATDSLQLDGVFENLRAGAYTVIVENAAGCRASAAATVEDAEKLYLFTPGKAAAQIQRGDSVRVPLNPNFTYDSLYWDDATYLSCGGCPTAFAAPPFTRTYVAAAVSPEGCPVRQEFNVTVFEIEESYAPTAFSPNGDGRNDEWKLVPGKRVEFVEDLRIYDRWGQLHMIREGKLPYFDEQLSWDGTQYGKKVDPGTYLYVATLHLRQGRTEQISGIITLIR